MDASTTARVTRAEQCRINAKARSEQKRQAAFDALSALQQERRVITKAAVARRAGVSVVFLRNHPDLLQVIEEATRTRPMVQQVASPADKVKDQVIAALRRRLEQMKETLATKEAALREKQRECDRLYGKLASASPLTDAEVRCALIDALERLTQAEAPSVNM